MNEMTIKLIVIIITIYMLLLFFQKTKYNVTLITMFIKNYYDKLIFFCFVIMMVILGNILIVQIPKNEYNLLFSIHKVFNTNSILSIIVNFQVYVVKILFDFLSFWFNYTLLINLKNFFSVIAFIDTIAIAIITMKFTIDMNDEEKAIKEYLKFVENNPETIYLLDKNNLDSTYYNIVAKIIKKDKINDNIDKLIKNLDVDMLSFHIIINILNNDNKNEELVIKILEKYNGNIDILYEYISRINTVDRKDLNLFFDLFIKKFDEQNLKNGIKLKTDDEIRKLELYEDLNDELKEIVLKRKIKVYNIREFYEYINKKINFTNFAEEEMVILSKALIEINNKEIINFIDYLVNDERVYSEKFIFILFDLILKTGEFEPFVFNMFNYISKNQLYRIEEDMLVKCSEQNNEMLTIRLKESYVNFFEEKINLEDINTNNAKKIMSEYLSINTEDKKGKIEGIKLNNYRKNLNDLLILQENFLPIDINKFEEKFSTMKKEVNRLIKNHNFEYFNEYNINYQNDSVTTNGFFAREVNFDNINFDNLKTSEELELQTEIKNRMIKLAEEVKIIQKNIESINISDRKMELRTRLKNMNNGSEVLFKYLYNVFFENNDNFSIEFIQKFLKNSANIVLPKIYNGLYINIHFTLVKRLFDENKTLSGLSLPFSIVDEYLNYIKNVSTFTIKLSQYEENLDNNNVNELFEYFLKIDYKYLMDNKEILLKLLEDKWIKLSNYRVYELLESNNYEEKAKIKTIVKYKNIYYKNNTEAYRQFLKHINDEEIDNLKYKKIFKYLSDNSEK